MIKRLILFVTVILLFANIANAQFTYCRQGFGLSTQYTIPILDKIPSNITGDFKAYSKYGAAIHYAVRFELTPHIYIASGLSYGRTNYELSFNNSSPSNPTQIKASLHTTTVPVLTYFLLSRKKQSILVRKWKPLAIAGIQLQTIKGAGHINDVPNPETAPMPYIFSYRPGDIQFGPVFTAGFALDSPLRRNNLWQIFATVNYSIWDAQNYSLTYATPTIPKYRSFISPNFLSFQVGVTYFPFAKRMHSAYANPKPYKYNGKICPFDAPGLRKQPKQSKMD